MDVSAEIVALLREHYVDPQRLEAWLDETDRHTQTQRLAEIGASHTRHLRPDEIDYFHLMDAYSAIAGFAKEVRKAIPEGARYPGIELLARQDASQRWFASSVFSGGAADDAGVRTGDELIAVNGRRYLPVSPFVGLEGQECVLEVRRARDGEKLSLRPRVRTIHPGRALERATRASVRKLRTRQGRTAGYVRPWSLAGDRYWRIVKNAAIEKLSDCAVLIVDLRGGVGGACPDFADFFSGRSPELALYSRHGPPASINIHWRKPVIALVDHTTRSGNEVLAFALQRDGAMLVGERTAGAVTAARPFLLSDRSILLVATHHVEVDGNILEGVGVVPDIQADAQVEYSAGADLALEAALTIDRS